MKKSENNKNNKFFELLIENDINKIKEFIILNGKTKPYCPIIFLTNKKDTNKLVEN